MNVQRGIGQSGFKRYPVFDIGKIKDVELGFFHQLIVKGIHLLHYTVAQQKAEFDNRHISTDLKPAPLLYTVSAVPDRKVFLLPVLKQHMTPSAGYGEGRHGRDEQGLVPVSLRRRPEKRVVIG